MSDHAVTAFHVCGSCSSPFVQPVSWSQPARGYWELVLRCPECEWVGTGVFTDEEAAGFADEFERGTEVLLEELRTLTASGPITTQDFASASARRSS